MLAMMAAAAGMTGLIEDTEDAGDKERAFEEMMEGKWRAIRAQELKPGHQMRDAEGGQVEIVDVCEIDPDHIRAVEKNQLGMLIPRMAVVLVAPTPGES